MPSCVSGLGAVEVCTPGSPPGEVNVLRLLLAFPQGIRMHSPWGEVIPDLASPRGIPWGEPGGADPDRSRLRGRLILFHRRSDPKHAFPHAFPLGECRKRANPHVSPLEEHMFPDAREIVFSGFPTAGAGVRAGEGVCFIETKRK